MPPLVAAVRVFVAVVSADASDGSTRSIEEALRTALARDAVIVVKSSEVRPDDAVADEARDGGASLVGVVRWSERERRASLHFMRGGDRRWIERDVRFDAADAPTERGRTVGFALASMMPDEAFNATAPPPPTPQPLAPSPVRFSEPVLAAVAEHPILAPRPSLRANPLAFEIGTSAQLAPAGYGGGVGGSLAVRIPLVGALAARAAFGARFGQIGPAQATSRAIEGAVGVALQPWLDGGRRWALGGRVDAVMGQQHVSHFSKDDTTPAVQTRLVPGFDAALECAFRFTERAAAVAAVGAEVAFGTTDVYTYERKVASIPPGRLLAELGVRVLF